MLSNLQHSYPAILMSMAETDFEFHLTGSRFWGTAADNSDWDFFVQNTVGLTDWLHAQGFTQYSKNSDYAGDGQCTEVWVHGPTFMTVNHEYKEQVDLSKQVHVQVVTDAAFKQKVQEQLFKLFPKGFDNKLLARAVWRTAFDFVKVVPEQQEQS